MLELNVVENRIVAIAQNELQKSIREGVRIAIPNNINDFGIKRDELERKPTRVALMSLLEMELLIQ